MKLIYVSFVAMKYLLHCAALNSFPTIYRAFHNVLRDYKHL